MWFEVVLCVLPWVAEVVVEESLVLSSWWLKNRYRIQGFARWRWLLQIADDR